jgi:hypothetical protein
LWSKGTVEQSKKGRVKGLQLCWTDTGFPGQRPGNYSACTQVPRKQDRDRSERKGYHLRPEHHVRGESQPGGYQWLPRNPCRDPRTPTYRDTRPLTCRGTRPSTCRGTRPPSCRGTRPPSCIGTRPSASPGQPDHWPNFTCIYLGGMEQGS